MNWRQHASAWVIVLLLGLAALVATSLVCLRTDPAWSGVYAPQHNPVPLGPQSDQNWSVREVPDGM